MFVVNNKILVIAYDSSTQKQVIWVSDGTAAGTTSFNPEYTEFSHNINFNMYFSGEYIYIGARTGSSATTLKMLSLLILSSIVSALLEIV